MRFVIDVLQAFAIRRESFKVIELYVESIAHLEVRPALAWAAGRRRCSYHVSDFDCSALIPWGRRRKSRRAILTTFRGRLSITRSGSCFSEREKCSKRNE